MKSLLFLADSWGYTKGGINSFNINLCKSVAAIIQPNIKVVCAVPYCTKGEHLDAETAGVSLINVHLKSEITEFQDSDMSELYLKLKKENITDVLWIIGHDVITGDDALKLKEKLIEENFCSPKISIIHHMDYESYSVFKAASHPKKSIEPKISHQRTLLRSADYAFGVGPYLEESAKEKVGEDVSMLIPGLDYLSKHTSSFNTKKFKIITFGRLDEENDIIKQTTLVVKAFGRAISIDERLKESILTVIGINKEGNQLQQLLEEGEKYASRKVTINGIPYIEKREVLNDILCEHSLCIMPSLREGFGLVGWEAISAGVPIIISDVSGLYKFLNSFGGNVEGCITKIDVTGSDKHDIPVLSKLILNTYNNLELARNNALTVNEYLKKSGYTWENTAHSLLTKLKLPANPLKDFASPFKYLNSFHVDESDCFFGRSIESKEFVCKLNNQFPILLLFGKSGVGKTSFINASIIPTLKSVFYSVLTVRPGIDNNKVLNKEINDFVIAAKDNQNKVIILDQFEEFFTNYNEQKREELLDLIIELRNSGSTKFIFSFREDFLAELYEIEKVIPDIYNNKFRLKNLTSEGAFEAIEKTFQIPKCSIDKELINDIINDLKQSEDNSVFPPQLQIFCYTLYQRFGGKGGKIKYEDYKSIGGIKGVLSEYVDEALERFNVRDKHIAKELLKNLVSSKGTKRPMKYSELSQAILNKFPDSSKNKIKEIIQILINSRLIIKYEYLDELAYELTHEYLIEKIKDWLSFESFKIKEVLEALNQEVSYWEIHHRPMELHKFEFICNYKDFIHPNNFSKAILLRTALEYNYELDYWLELNLDNKEVIELLYVDIRRIKNNITKCRLISSILIFNISDEYVKNIYGEILKSGNKRILQDYLSWSKKFAKYNINIEVEIRRNIETKLLSHMVYVEEGDFILGRDKNELNQLISDGIPKNFFKDESVLKRQFTGGFLIDKFLVSNSDYSDFNENHSFQIGREKHPVTSISYDDAVRYAKINDKLIPDEVLWEKAARGKDGRIFPWGNEWDSNKCNTRLSGISGTTEIDKYQNGISPYGCYDMAGNVWEWTSTWKNKNKTLIVKGGSWAQMKVLPWCSYKFDYEKEGQQNVGFRCVRIIKNDLENSNKVYSAGGVVLNIIEGIPSVLICRNEENNEWRLPKGMLEKDESVLSCAIREVKEETSLDSKIIGFIDFINWSYVYNNKVWDETVFFYLMEAIDIEIGSHDKEFDFVGWKPLEESISLLTFKNEKDIVKSAIKKYES
jgi:glycosyltransferase involved in cell wall biosynthesis/8-oxo-dGTP pyrophosphatase MutT (NUDIX family)